jgi:hypothetical protein
MSRSFLLALGLACAAWLPSARAGDPPAAVPPFALEAPKVASGPPVFQFNGKDLTGFYAYTRDHKYNDPKQVFTVVDGMIRISGEEFGGLATGGNFANYHLLTEWKWGQRAWPPRTDKARDSGILVHCVGPDGAGLGQWMQSQECQIIEGGTGDFIMVPGLEKPSLTCETRTGPDNQPYFEKGGTAITRNSGRYNWWGRDPAWKDVLGFRGSRDVENPVGEWNRMDVICDGDTITVYLNRHVVNVGTKSSLTMGKIQFQSEGAEIFFRRIEIRPLKK